jgi:regulatory protein
MTAETRSKSAYQNALNTAVRLLTRRDHTRHEIQQKLKLRGFRQNTIDRVVTECERLDYINDERTERIFIEQLVKRGFGFRRIPLELRKKGLKGDCFEEMLKDNGSEIDEYEIAESVLKKKARGLREKEDIKKRRDRLYRFLNYRGFSEQVISELLKNYS